VSRPEGTAAFWIDQEYDRDQASDGVSRFGAYVRQSAALAECWDGTWDDPGTRQARFAAAAWSTATGPVMAPGYVRHHPRVLAGTVACNGWDGTLNGLVRLVTPRPQPLAQSPAWHSAEAWWEDWPTQPHGGDTVYYREPDDDETAARPYLMASAALIFPLSARALPAAPAGPCDDIEDRAREAVRVLTGAMNGVVAPVIELLERP
jgi:hypothetical protein